MNSDPRVDAYIAKSPAFAQPILTEVRARIRKACPPAEETIKWNVPFYVLDGQLFASLAAFKKHTKIGVWADGKGDFQDVTSVAELPPAKDFIRRLEANAKGSSAPRATPTKKTSAPATKTATAKPASAKAAASKKATAKKAPSKKAAAKLPARR